MVTGIDGEFAGFKTSILLVSSLAVTSHSQTTPQATEAVVSDSQPEQPKVAVIHLPVPAPGLHDLDHMIEVLGGLSIVLSVLAGGGFSAIRQVQFYAILQFLTCSTHDESPEPLLWTNLLLEEPPVRHDSYLIELFIGNLFCIGVMLVSLWILRTVAFVLRRTLPQNDTSNCIAQRAHFLEYPRGELMVLEFSLPGLCMSSGWALTSSQSLFVAMGATCLVLTFVPFVVPLGLFALREQLLQFLHWTAAATLPRAQPQTTTYLRAQYQKLERWRYKGTWEEQTRPASLTWKFSRPIILGYRELPSLVIWAMFLLFHLRQFGTGLVAGLAVGPNAVIRASTALWVLCGLHGIELSILLLSGLLSAEVSGLPFRDKIVDIMEITAGIGRLILLVLALCCREGTEIITAMRTANASVTAGLSLLEILSAACGAAGMKIEQDEHRNETERTRTDDNPNLEDSAQDASQDDTAHAHLGFEGVSDGSTPSFHNGNEDNWGNFAPNATTPQAQQLPSMPVPPDLQPQLGTQHVPERQHDPYAPPDWISTGPDMSDGQDNTPPSPLSSQFGLQNQHNASHLPRNTVPIPLQNFSDRRAHGAPVRRLGLDG